MAGELKHFYIIVVVTNGHDLIAPVAAVGGPSFERVSLGAARIQDIDHGQISFRIFGPQDGDTVVHSDAFKDLQGLGHPCHRAAKHRLDGIAYQRIFDRDNEFDVGHILFQPTADAGVQIIQVFEHDCALGFFIKGQNGVAAEVLHCAAQLAAGFAWHQVAMECFSAERAGYCAVRTDEPEIEA